MKAFTALFSAIGLCCICMTQVALAHKHSAWLKSTPGCSLYFEVRFSPQINSPQIWLFSTVVTTEADFLTIWWRYLSWTQRLKGAATPGTWACSRSTCTQSQGTVHTPQAPHLGSSPPARRPSPWGWSAAAAGHALRRPPGPGVGHGRPSPGRWGRPPGSASAAQALREHRSPQSLCPPSQPICPWWC